MTAGSLRLWSTLLFLLGTIQAGGAEYHEATPAENEFAALEARYAPPSAPTPTPPPTPAQHAVQQTTYVSASPAQGPSLPSPPAAEAIGPVSGPTIYPAPQNPNEVIIPPSSDAWCMPPQEPLRTSSWTAAIELIPSVTRLTDGQFGRWDDDTALALRLVLGYEDPEGIGIRGRFWGLSQEAETPADDVELNMGRFDLDLYKRVFLDRGELVLGAGPASGSLEFKLSDNTHSEFEGAGGTLFAEGYYPLIGSDTSQLGAIVRARYSILLGDWRDTTGGLIVPRTDNDTLSVTELAWGLEYRRCFGKCDDHSWFLGILAEYQRWQSDWLSNLAGTSIGVSGLNVYTGLNW